MAAEIESYAWAGAAQQRPWHGLGHHVGDEGMRWGEALREAKLDWTASFANLYTASEVGNPIIPSGYGRLHKVDEWKAVVRDTDRALLGVVGKRFKIVQNEDLLRFTDALVESGQLRFESLGALRGGKVIFAVAKADKSFFVGKDDEVEPYLFAANAHDGSMELTFGLTTIRIVCMNTLRAALMDKTTKKFRVRHSGAADEGDNLDLSRHEAAAKATLGLFHEHVEETRKTFNQLAATPYTEDHLKRFLDTMFPLPAEDKDPGKATANRERFLDALVSAPGQELESAAGTLWGLLNGATAYATHRKSTRGGDDGRLHSQLLGSAADFGQRAMSEVVSYLN